MRHQLTHISRRIVAATVLAGSVAGQAAGQEPPGTREIGRTTEREVRVVLTSSFGDVRLSRGDHEKIVLLRPETAESRAVAAGLEYSVRNRIGYLELSLGERSKEDQGKGGAISLTGIDRGSWDLTFSDALPISFDIELGMGSGVFDLSGLQVKDFNLSTGAGEVEVTFGSPNTSSIDNLTIESGVSTFRGTRLCNANFRRLMFKGGVGSYSLDFGGALSGEVDVDVEVGLGMVTMHIPPEVGVKLFAEKSWVSSLSLDDDFKPSAESEYVTENYYQVPARMNIRIDNSFGSVKVRRR